MKHSYYELPEQPANPLYRSTDATEAAQAALNISAGLPLLKEQIIVAKFGGTYYVVYG